MRRRKATLALVTSQRRAAFCLAIFLVAVMQVRIQARQGTPVTDQGSISRGKEPAEVLATVSAMTQEPYYRAHILVIEVLKVLSGKNPGQYLRADFPNRALTTDSEDAQAYQRLEKALRLQRIWRIHLRPPRGSDNSECTRRVPAPLRPGELTAFEHTTMVPVAGATGYPDVNALACYVFEQKDIQAALPSNF
jgi:hypothetical protein